MKPNNRSFGNSVRPSNYSASKVEQNKEAYRQDGRVRTAEELAKVIKRRESIDVASMRVFAPVLSGDEMRGQDEEVDTPYEASRAAGPGRRREASNSALNLLKERSRGEWMPEYIPQSHAPPSGEHAADTVSERGTRVSLKMIMDDVPNWRKTKIVCTLGPKCNSEDTMGKLLDAGLGIARFNFSHGDHATHGEVLERFRKVCADKGSMAGVLLDTKGPEIRTAMLRNHEAIELEQGQEIIVEAVGDAYTSFEGYKTPEETRIGLSYAGLCKSMKPGQRILLADGTISIEVIQILNERELKGRVLNSKKLGERKNGNLPGVKVDIPVLTAKDIDDLQNFCVKNKMDFVAASFVQSAEDVQFIRRVLDEVGGQNVQIISKIENEAGLRNFDEILKYTDGVMVARGDLGMEIPSWKVPQAQKMLITKCNIAGKFVITATQMLESMISNPLPTRAEMTDVANAVFDGTDAVMLSGETANGDFPVQAVRTMAAIVQNAELGIDYYSQFTFIEYWNTAARNKAISPLESTFASVSKMAVDFHEDTNQEETQDGVIMIVMTKNGTAADLVAKYRPPHPVVVVSPNEQVLRQTNSRFGQYPYRPSQFEDLDVVGREVVDHCLKNEMYGKPKKAIIVHGSSELSADERPVIKAVKEMRGLNRLTSVRSGADLRTPKGTVTARAGVASLRSTSISLDSIVGPITRPRSTKIICTLGPKCSSEEGLSALIDAGMNIARFNFSHGDHESHGAVLQRLRDVCERKRAEIMAKTGTSTAPVWATLLDTKGPEIRTAMLRNHEAIELEQGQMIIVEAVGANYTSFEGYKTPEETRIGLSYQGLCQSMKPGQRILLADGTISIEVIQILNERELKGRVLNSKKLGERKNCNLPGVKVDIPVLTSKDIDDLQNFCVKNKMDFVAASFVQSAEDVQFIRKVLDDAGGKDVKIISKIENQSGLTNFDEILKYTDGVMVARGDLGMEIPSEKVALAQKMLITKCTIAGKFVVTATQMLESMISNPLPTRAEMTDVANAVFDGTDAVMLSGETANGDFPAVAVSTMAEIVLNAESAQNNYSLYNFIRNHTSKPMNDAEAICSSAVQTALDCGAKAIVLLTSSGRAGRLVAKYRPRMPVFAATNSLKVALQCNANFGVHPFFLSDPIHRVADVMKGLIPYARKLGIVDITDHDPIVVVHRRNYEQTGNLAFRVMVTGHDESAAHVEPTSYRGSTTLSFRSTKIGMDTIAEPTKFNNFKRKTKIVCTMGPKCSSEEMIGKLLDAGMNVARFNFSHGDHASHGEVLLRYMRVCDQKGKIAAALLDTKGPEIRTAMLRNHQPIELEQGQEITVEAVGDAYTSFEGYKTPEETRIGLSYAGLCKSMKPGQHILLADGTISIEVIQILNERELKGRVLNSKKLGERKNCNLPGVKVDIPVLTSKDIDDLQNFCVKFKMDFVAASFVQSAEDVQFIRRVLDEVGGHEIKIISKIENQAGLDNFDEILKYTDGVMVARGDLGMEIPSEKVALAQKMLITKCNIAGKFVITATQMLESMIANPMPTRAEMTDVANAVFDGTDAVMLSGETANGDFPKEAVHIMHRIVKNAELGVNSYQVYDFIRDFTPKPVSNIEAFVANAAKNANDMGPGIVVAFSEGGKTMRLVAKYRPNVPVMLLTSNQTLARQCTAIYGLFPFLLDRPVSSVREVMSIVEVALAEAVNQRPPLCPPGREVIVLSATHLAHGLPRSPGPKGFELEALPERQMYFERAPGHLSVPKDVVTNRSFTAKTLSLRATNISLEMVTSKYAPVRKMKIIATMGAKCDSEEVMAQMLDAGMDIAKINLAHGTREQHKQVLERYRKVCAAKGKPAATMCDTQGPVIRTGLLVDGIPIPIKAGDLINLVADEDFVGFRNDKETKIGVSYPDLCRSLNTGSIILVAYGALELEVQRIVSEGELVAKAVNAGTMFEQTAMYLPGITINLPVLTEKDADDIRFACRNGVNSIALSFVQSPADVSAVRAILSEEGADNMRIIAKIENLTGLKNLDSILAVSDGVLVARGDLGIDILPEKVALAQKVIVTKCNVAGKPAVVARHMLESMISNPLPTRAEMTDVANAVLDGADLVMLGSETANGEFPVQAVRTMAAIVQNAEQAVASYSMYSFLRDFSAKPFSTVESIASNVSKCADEAKGSLVVVISELGIMAQLISKYRPRVPVMVITSDENTCADTALMFAQTAVKVPALQDTRGMITAAVRFAEKEGKWKPGTGPLVLVHGLAEPDSDTNPMMRVVETIDDI